MHGRPNDERRFLHKKLFGAISTASGLLPFPGGNIISRITGGLAGRGRGATPIATLCPPGTAGCPGGFGAFVPPEREARRPRKTRGLRGAAERFFPGGASGFDDEFGEAVMGRYGAAIEPATFTSEVRQCPRGTVLGNDGLCYNKSDIKNTEREWPRGTRPLLTGGEMRCIRIASRAAGKLRTKEKQLRRMGMLPALPKARRAKTPALAAGHHVHAAHD